MKEFFRSRSVGFYLSLAVIVLTIVAMAVYPQSINFASVGETMLVFALVFELIYVIGGRFTKSEHWDLLSIVIAVLLAIAVCGMLFFQMEQIGWCFSGLDEWNILTVFFVACGVAIAGMAAAVVGCFFRQAKAE